MRALARLLSGNLNNQPSKPVEKADTSSRTGSEDAEEDVLRNKFDKDTVSSAEDSKYAKHASGAKVRNNCEVIPAYPTYFSCADS